MYIRLQITHISVTHCAIHIINSQHRVGLFLSNYCHQISVTFFPSYPTTFHKHVRFVLQIQITWHEQVKPTPGWTQLSLLDNKVYVSNRASRCFDIKDVIFRLMKFKKKHVEEGSTQLYAPSLFFHKILWTAEFYETVWNGITRRVNQRHYINYLQIKFHFWSKVDQTPISVQPPHIRLAFPRTAPNCVQIHTNSRTAVTQHFLT